MCNLYSITTNQAAIIALFRVINRYVGNLHNLQPMPGVFPDYPAPVDRAAGAERELTMRWGMPASAARRGFQYPQHDFAPLARLVEARKSLLGPGKQLRRVRAGTEPRDQKEGRGVVRAQR
jgi:putative SOS response-associated peptidase YedK